ncbi:MAG: hypothetical protein JST67_10900 [Bacteroidetes bacterium]|nr:hypothetical protein [Bacteroidota bacterium]
MKNPFFALFLVLVLASFSADDGFKNLFSVKNTSDFFTTDNIGNSYLINDEEIKKYNQTGDLLKIYSNKTIGKITQIDASNPLRILVFYKDFATIIILDDLLSQNGDPINLMDYSLEQSDVMCNSFNNGIWFFNRQNMELIRLDANFQTVVNTGNLNRLLKADFKPNFMVESNSYLYVNNPTEGIFVFDIYGTYAKTIPIKGLQHFQVKEDMIYYFLDGKFKAYSMKTISDQEISFSKANDVRIEKDTYFVFYNDSLCAKTPN